MLSCLQCRLFSTIVLVSIKVAQQSVHLTCGSLRGLQAFFWLRVFPTSQATTTPAHKQVTQTVGCFLQNEDKTTFINIFSE
jgi:hypothetical protein